MAVPPIVAVEVGTTKVVALVGEMRDDGHVMITGMGQHPSAGIRKGEVIDLENAVVCVRAALEAAEENSRVTVRQVHLAVSGGHIQSVVNRGTVPVLSRSREITQEDIEQVMGVAQAVNLPADRDILHTVCQRFCIDDQERVINPEGMEGAKLALDMLVIHGVRSRLRNTMKVVHSIPLEVYDVAFSGLCSALSVLTTEQKQSGVIVIDLGGGTTDYIVYADGVVAIAGALGVGGDHITNDVAVAFNIPPSRAESLKRDSGCAVVDVWAASQKVVLPPEVGFPGQTVKLKSLHTVINARMDEILGTVRKRLDEQGVTHQLGAGVVLTGGGAHLRGAGELAERVFRLPCCIGKPAGLSGLAAATEGPEYATACGLVAYGFNSQKDRGNMEQPLRRWLKSLLGR